MTPTVASLVDPVRVLSLKYPTLAGEVGTKDTCNADTYADRVCLRNCFGPAESPIYYTWNGPIQAQNKPACIEKLPSSRILLVTQPHNPHALVPDGCVGELFIKGSPRPREYLHDAQKTVTSFIINPAFLDMGPSESSRRFYRTGDLVHYNDEGSLISYGRRDLRIKFHCQRPELKGNEHHIQSHEAVKHSLVPSTSFSRTSKQKAHRCREATGL